MCLVPHELETGSWKLLDTQFPALDLLTWRPPRNL